MANLRDHQLGHSYARPCASAEIHNLILSRISTGFPLFHPRFPCPPRHVTIAASGAEKTMRAHTMLFAAAIGGLALAVAMSRTRDPLIEEAAAQVRGKPSAAATADVDVELVIAVDVS